MEQMEKLNQFIKETLDATDAGYSREYKESKWYKKPTIKDAFGDTISQYVVRLKEAMETGSDLTPFVEELETAARNFGASWFDEDLNMVRTGSEWECETLTFLRNLAAENLGIKPVPLAEFYEGYGM